MDLWFSVVFCNNLLILGQIAMGHAKYDVAFLAWFIDDVYGNITNSDIDNDKTPTPCGLVR